MHEITRNHVGPRHRVRVLAVLALAALAATAPGASAQYFGQNKVQYRDFDFEILRTEHFDIYYYEEEEAAIRVAARLAERWYGRLSRVLRHELSGRQPLVIYASHPHFEQTNVVSGALGEGTGGVTEALKRRIVLPFTAGLAETDHVIGHELVHAFQYDILGARGAGISMPLWFIEGMAEYLSIGSSDVQTAMWMRDAGLREQLPAIEELENPRYFPYRYGHALWAYLGGRFGDGITGDALRQAAGGAEQGPQQMGGGRAGADVLEALTGIDRKTLSADWHEAVQRDMVRPVATARESERLGRLLLGAEGNENERELNVGPALSPDGRRLAFLSAREQLSIDLYVADAETGDIVRKVVSTAGDPHFESLQFLNSGGTWDPAGRQLAFAALRSGRPVIAIVDAESGERTRELEIAEADEVFQPAWSPDGKQIVVSALIGGLSDLLMCDVASGRVTRLTDDAYADLHPAWSPDGRTLAFTTDRFGANLDALAFGRYQIGRMDVATRRIEQVKTFDEGRNSNPQWSADGRSLYFLATPGGIPDVYRLDLGRGEPQPVTTVRTGVSGITALSPALSVAARADRVAFVLYRGGGQSIHLVDAPAQTGNAAPADTTLAAERLAPVQRRDAAVDRLLGRPGVALPPAGAVPAQAEPYRARLSLDYVGQQFGGVALGPLGAQAAGGISMMWSDMLGNHTLASTLYVQGTFEDIGGQVGYVNREHRWNWGGFVEQFPYTTGTFASGGAIVQGQPAEVLQEVRYRQVDRQLSGVLAYPFSRAQRVEIGASLRRISFEQEVRTQAYSLATGELLVNDEREEQIFSPLTLGMANAALVYDSSVFGATGPILGQRFRFEVTPTTGDLFFTGALADFRRYFMPARPWTIAARLLHVGRYGRDAENERLGGLFLGYPTLVRGYDVGSLSAQECGSSLDGTCPALDRLVGSRVLVANLELRVPLVGAFTGDFDYGPIPIEAFAFADAGTAWTTSDSPRFAGGSRDVVRSVGGGVRVNALGYLVLQLDAARPLDRPDKDWRFLFTISPGF